MSTPQTQLSLTDTSAPHEAVVDALVVASRSDPSGVVLVDGHRMPEGPVAAIRRALDAVGAEGKAEEVVRLGGIEGISAPLVLVTGLGPEPTGRRGVQRPAVTEQLRRGAGAAARALAGKDTAVFALGAPDPGTVSAVAEGALLGGYVFADFYGAGRSASARAPLGTALVPGPPGSADTAALSARVEAVVDAVRYTRDLVNTPPNVLYPESFAASVRDHAPESVEVEVWDADRLRAEGCGGILGVGSGSARQPRLVAMTYRPAGATAHLALVGKGITFDSGGLCIKPAAAMVTMKCDMGGAAAVAATIIALARLAVPVAVTGYLCLAENMTGDLAQRPGDVVSMRGGTTVEIINTDAEGRLVMADGLALASEQRPDAVVDVATLTGACIIALGNRTLGVMGNDDILVERVTSLARSVGEPAWPLPLVEELRPSLDSPVADIKHTGERAAGAMVAATFLAEFVGDDASGEPLPWAHLDIAGPAYHDKGAYGYTTKGGTGAGVRTLIALAESYAG